jgi:hypothetical protein
MYDQSDEDAVDKLSKVPPQALPKVKPELTHASAEVA